LLILLATALVHADATGRVVAVTDGDTIKVLGSDKVQHKVRLTGRDAPELDDTKGEICLHSSTRGFTLQRLRPGAVITY
jgi:endonuclease YncB( thermonuclease family)